MRVENAKERFVWMMIGGGKLWKSLTAICELLFTKKMFGAHKRRYFSPLLPGTAYNTLCLFAFTSVSEALVLFVFIVSLFLDLNDRFAPII